MKLYLPPRRGYRASADFASGYTGVRTHGVYTGQIVRDCGVVYLGVWYFGFVRGGKCWEGAGCGARALLVFLGPIVIFSFIRRIVQI
ncbi:hypothetical protein DFH06DRAFT_282739 [Mycena polygramma]|nr:hypothetical protein DFH06DRAFT_282739 [Mycena polygramma]